jgi:hypothetical protein
MAPQTAQTAQFEDWSNPKPQFEDWSTGALEIHQHKLRKKKQPLTKVLPLLPPSRLKSCHPGVDYVMA